MGNGDQMNEACITHCLDTSGMDDTRGRTGHQDNSNGVVRNLTERYKSAKGKSYKTSPPKVTNPACGSMDAL